MEVDQIEVVADLEVVEDEETMVEAVQVLAGRCKDREEDEATVTQPPMAQIRTSWMWTSHCRRMPMVCVHSAFQRLRFILLTAPSPLKPTAEPSVSARGRGIPAYRGRGRGGTFIPRLPADIAFPGKGRGFDIPRRQVQGIGAPKDARRPIPVGAKQTLSSLLLQERPLLKPIMFVPSTETRFLFQNEEELLQPTVESVGGCTWIFCRTVILSRFCAHL